MFKRSLQPLLLSLGYLKLSVLIRLSFRSLESKLIFNQKYRNIRYLKGISIGGCRLHGSVYIGSSILRLFIYFLRYFAEFLASSVKNASEVIFPLISEVPVQIYTHAVKVTSDDCTLQI